MRILVVDDSVDSRLLVRAILAGEGYRDVQLVATAAEAFRLLGLDPPDASAAPVDLILLDLLMPGMDGIEACRRINSVERLREVPLILVTGSSEVDSLPAAFAAGAMDYLTKPVNAIELAARVRSALKLKDEMDRRKAREADLLETTRKLEAANEKLLHLSQVDGLTGLANRRRFDEFIDQEWRRMAREKLPLSVIMLDIDHFKRYNDRYGHVSGDDCLRRVAAALQDSLRRPQDLVARYGGEEFAVVLPGTAAAGALHVAEEILTRVAGLALPHDASPTAAVVSVSVGVATREPAPPSSPGMAIAAADGALYSAKNAGRNRVGVAAPASPQIA